MSLGVLLVSCGATRHAAPERPEDLSQFVLVIRRTPDGQATHSWQRFEDFDGSQYYPRQTRRSSMPGQVVLVGSEEDRCEAQYYKCLNECFASRLPKNFNHYTYRDPNGKARYCYEMCGRKLADCMRLAGREPQRFTAIDPAIDWLKRHSTELQTGAIITVGAVALVVIVAAPEVIVVGAVGALVLAEAPGAQADVCLVEVSQ